MKERVRDKGLETLTEAKLWAATLELYWDDNCSVVEHAVSSAVPYAGLSLVPPVASFAMPMVVSCVPSSHRW